MVVSIITSIPTISVQTAVRPVVVRALPGKQISAPLIKGNVVVQSFRALVTRPIVLGPTDARQEVFASATPPSGLTYPAINFTDVGGGLQLMQVNA